MESHEQQEQEHEQHAPHERERPVDLVAGADTRDTKKRRRFFGNYDPDSDRGLRDAGSPLNVPLGTNGGGPQRHERHGLVALARPTEIIAVIGILGLILGALGFRYTSITAIEQRVTALESKGELSSFILCAMARRDHPDLEPPECAPIIQNHDHRAAK